jgi:hypothetical protein
LVKTPGEQVEAIPATQAEQGLRDLARELFGVGVSAQLTYRQLRDFARRARRVQEREELQANDVAFESFYTVYPRPASRPEALKSWRALRPDAELVAKMMAAIEEQVAANHFGDIQFTPHPATWLRERRWEDPVVIQS